MINQWNTNWGKFKDHVPHMSCLCCGSILVSNARGYRFERLYYNDKYFCQWIQWIQWKHLGKALLCSSEKRFFPVLLQKISNHIRMSLLCGEYIVKTQIWDLLFIKCSIKAALHLFTILKYYVTSITSNLECASWFSGSMILIREIPLSCKTVVRSGAGSLAAYRFK